MMWGYNGGMGWTVFFGLLIVISIATLVVLAVRLSAGTNDRREPGPPPGPGAPGAGPAAPGAPGRSRARQILDERFAAGELTQEQYLEQVRALGEGPA